MWKSLILLPFLLVTADYAEAPFEKVCYQRPKFLASPDGLPIATLNMCVEKGGQTCCGYLSVDKKCIIVLCNTEGDDKWKMTDVQCRDDDESDKKLKQEKKKTETFIRW